MKKAINLTGKIFGKLTVIREGKSRIRTNGRKQSTWICKCDCGRPEFEILQNNLTRGNSQQCVFCSSKEKAAKNSRIFHKGQVPHNFEDLTGKQFHKLTVISGPIQKILKNGKKVNLWKTRCTCGNEREISTALLKKFKSCFKCSRKKGIDSARYKGGGLASLFRKQKNRIYKDRKRFISLGLTFEISEEYFSNQIQKECFYCGLSPTLKVRGASVLVNTLDRFDSSLGYIESNIVTACLECNLRKRDSNGTDFLHWVNRVHSHQTKLLK